MHYLTPDFQFRRVTVVWIEIVRLISWLHLVLGHTVNEHFKDHKEDVRLNEDLQLFNFDLHQLFSISLEQNIDHKIFPLHCLNFIAWWNLVLQLEIVKIIISKNEVLWVHWCNDHLLCLVTTLWLIVENEKCVGLEYDWLSVVYVL